MDETSLGQIRLWIQTWLPQPVKPASVMTAVVAGDGSITAGSGFGVVRDSQGNYTVTFDTEFVAAPLVLGMANGLDEYFNAESVATTGFTCSTPNHLGVGQDVGFMFSAQPVV